MKSSLALHIKSWTSKIHPPLPRTPRESQQLLSALITSFRGQFDAQHPPIHNGRQLRRNSDSGERLESQIPPLSSAASTDRHIRFILRHPLFESMPRPLKDPHTHTLSTDSEKSAGRRFEIAERGRMLRDPMAYFDQRVASGSAGYETVELCLQAQKSAALSSSDIDNRNTMRKSGAGSRVARWFATTTDADKASFLQRRNAVRLAASFLLVEDLRNVLWRWYHAPEEFSFASKSGIAEMQRNLLVAFLEAETRVGEGLSSALKVYLDAATRSDVSSGGSLTHEHRESQLSLDMAGLYLMRLIIRSDWKNDRTTLPVGLFEAFVREQDKWSHHAGPERFHLMLCHPTHPDPSPALQYIRTLSTSGIDGMSKNSWRYCLRLCLDTAEMLLAQEKYDEGNFVLDCVNEKFFKGWANQPAKDERARAQDVINSAMLERLDVGYS